MKDVLKLAEELGLARDLIVIECNEIKDLLLKKNEKYGNAVLAPKRIFSKADPVEQIKVRIDDKLNRIEQMGTDKQVDEDTVKDLIGYLILLRVADKYRTRTGLATQKVDDPSFVPTFGRYVTGGQGD